MANPNAPYGFKYVGLLDGSVPSFGFYKGLINPAAATKAFQGDIAAPISGGYFAAIAAETGGGAPIGGILIGEYEWNSLTARMLLFQNWWSGNAADVPAGGTVGCAVVLNPNSVFQVRSSGGSGVAVPQSAVGSNVNLSLGAGGNTLNGLSSMGIDDATIGGGASLPFKIYKILQAPESDPTSIYNEVLVTFNNLSGL